TAGGGRLQFSELDAGSQDSVLLSTTLAYDGYTGGPSIGDFNFNYRWYYVKSQDTTDVFSRDENAFAAIDTTKSDISGATLIDGATGATYTPNISEIGTYKFFVEVEYLIKDRSTGMGSDVSTNRNRPYVIYRDWFGGTDQETASIVTITPAPGKPHITIEEVED